MGPRSRQAILLAFFLVSVVARVVGRDPGADSAAAAAAAAFARDDHRRVMSLLRSRLSNTNGPGALAWLPLLAQACETTQDEDCAMRAHEATIAAYDHLSGINRDISRIASLNGLGLILSRRGQHTRHSSDGEGMLCCTDNDGLWNNFGTVAHTARLPKFRSPFLRINAHGH